ncbi:MAG: HlyD family efflux transporter periplasmic adaptor subunit [Burkholderiaceae bacterium]|nr:HlyD family efflux transporter periplasmic adaptor subunit [Burkholderiaceae bacterium]
MKTKTWILGGLAVTAGVALLAWAFAPRPLEVETGVADRGPFETVITEEGRTTLRQRFTVSAPLTGRLARITLEAGDTVAAGSVLATLSPTLAPMLDARTQRELTARVAAAQANMQRAGSQAEAARVALVQARSAQQRSAELARQGFVSPIQAENDALAVDAAQKALDAAQQGRVVARHELEVARAALAAVATGADPGPARGFDVRAPVAGRVLRVLQASEGTVALGTPLLELGDLAQLEVVAELLTTDALQAGAGRPVRIEDWGGGPGTLQGRVRLVEPAGFTKVSALGVEEQRVRVHIDLTSPPGDWQTLGDGYRVTVRIVTRQVDDALRVPVSAVFPRPEGGHAVFLVDAGRARLQPVDLAARNETHAWLRGGVDAGAAVIVYPPAALTEGVRVRMRGS